MIIYNDKAMNGLSEQVDLPCCRLTCFYSFVGNADFWKHKKKHPFIERMLDKHVFGHEDKTKEMLEDIKPLDTDFVIQ